MRKSGCLYVSYIHLSGLEQKLWRSSHRISLQSSVSLMFKILDTVGLSYQVNVRFTKYQHTKFALCFLSDTGFIKFEQITQVY